MEQEEEEDALSGRSLWLLYVIQWSLTFQHAVIHLCRRIAVIVTLCCHHLATMEPDRAHRVDLGIRTWSYSVCLHRSDYLLRREHDAG